MPCELSPRLELILAQLLAGRHVLKTSLDGGESKQMVQEELKGHMKTLLHRSIFGHSVLK